MTDDPRGPVLWDKDRPQRRMAPLAVRWALFTAVLVYLVLAFALVLT